MSTPYIPQPAPATRRSSPAFAARDFLGLMPYRLGLMPYQLVFLRREPVLLSRRRGYFPHQKSPEEVAEIKRLCVALRTPSSSSSAKSVVEDSPLPFAEGIPAPKSEKLFLTIDGHTEAVVEITIKTSGLGPLDPPTRSAPTVGQLHTVADLLLRRAYQFTESPH